MSISCKMTPTSSAGQGLPHVLASTAIGLALLNPTLTSMFQSIPGSITFALHGNPLWVSIPDRHLLPLISQPTMEAPISLLSVTTLSRTMVLLG